MSDCGGLTDEDHVCLESQLLFFWRRISAARRLMASMQGGEAKETTGTDEYLTFCLES